MRSGAASIVDLVAGGALDAELAALLWLLVESGVPAVVAGPPGDGGAEAVRDALLDLAPPDARPVRLGGEAEDFAWLPEATELGWRQGRAAGARPSRTAGRPLLVAELVPGAAGTWGERARVAIRAVALGYPMAATIVGARLEDVLAGLSAPPVGATDDELSRLGVVLVLGEGAAAGRVVAAHFLRPVARDAHGHVQRLPPAVLAARDAGTGALEHFAWGIVAELAARTGRRAAELEREQARRASFLAGLASAGVSEPGDVRAAIAGYRAAGGATATV